MAERPEEVSRALWREVTAVGEYGALLRDLYRSSKKADAASAGGDSPARRQLRTAGPYLAAAIAAALFLPHVLCLSSSSPFWLGRNTGLKSYRSIIFRGFPRSGLPPRFGSWAELNYLVESLVRTNCVPDGTKLWWDVRPNWKYPTLEFRVCDCQEKCGGKLTEYCIEHARNH